MTTAPPEPEPTEQPPPETTEPDTETAPDEPDGNSWTSKPDDGSEDSPE